MAVAVQIDLRERTVGRLHPKAAAVIRASDVIQRRWADVVAAEPTARPRLLNRLGREIKALGSATEAFIPMEEG